MIPLPGLIRSEALSRARSLQLADRADRAFDQRQEVIDDVLDWLWRVVARPVLDALDPDSRLWWCLTGPLTLLPVHAARERGRHEPDHRLDGRVVSSYTVTLDALLRSRRPSSGRPAAQLVVGVPEIGVPKSDVPKSDVPKSDVPDSGDMPPLPSVAREVAGVAARASMVGPVLALVGSDATCRRVCEELSGYDRVHLACHVRPNTTDPARTGLLLADGLLTIAQLAELDLPDGELAVLSACGTAVGSARLLDEAVHVAAAMQVIGYRHVVATLWSVPDAAGTHFAEAFYDCLGDGRTASRITGALRHAVWAIQQRYADGSPVWAPFVHFGP